MQNVHVHLEMPKDGYSLLDLAILYMYAVLEITSSNWLFSGHFSFLSGQNCI